MTESVWERCYPEGKVLHDGTLVDGWCRQCGHLKLAHHISGQCAPCQIIVEAQLTEEPTP